MDYSFSLVEDTENCLCGSGNAFQKCCKLRLSEAKPKQSLGSFKGDSHLSHFMQDWYKKTSISQCLHPNQSECQGNIINAHALQNNGVLTKIAVDSHVMAVNHLAKIRKQVVVRTLTPENIKNTIEMSSGHHRKELLEVLSKVDKVELFAFMGQTCELEIDMPVIEFEMKKLSINKATTFRGFCSLHDKIVFKPIEDFAYIGTEEQNFLFSYRTFSQEYYEQIAVEQIKKEHFYENPKLCYNHSFVQEYRYAINKKRHLDRMKNILDTALISENFSTLTSKKVKLTKPCDFALTSVILPEVDLEGNVLNDAYLSNKDSRHILLTIFPTDTETVILFSWLAQDNLFFESYSHQIGQLTENEVKHYTSNLISYSPNIVIGPKLWNAMSENEKASFQKSLEFQMEETAFGQSTPKFLSAKRNETLKKRKYLLETPSYDLFR